MSKANNSKCRECGKNTGNPELELCFACFCINHYVEEAEEFYQKVDNLL